MSEIKFPAKGWTQHMSKWTSHQQQAIKTRDCDLLVCAAAGSGKTAVLVERVIERVANEGGSVDRLLVVTFTKAAASEMSQRVGEALARKLETDGENIHLQNQLTLLSRADIKTIHAFCLQVIREYYHLLDIDPAVRTADPGEMKLIRRDVLDEMFEELYGRAEAWFFVLLETFGEETKDTRLKELVLKIYEFAQGYPQPEQLLHQIAEQFQLSEMDTVDSCVWIPIIKEGIYNRIESALSVLQEAKAMAVSAAGFDAYADCLEKECEAVSALLSSMEGGYRQWHQAYVAVDFGRLGAYRGEEKEMAERIKNLRNEGKDEIKKLGETFFCFDAQMQTELIRALYPTAKGLSALTLLFMERFAAQKKEKLVIDFHDYEHFALKILVEPDSRIHHILPTAVAREIQQRYDEIMIDEYQDSNMVQEMILSAVSKESCGENNRFMVGDVKQSIYRFRLAMPELFNAKYNTYPIESGGKTQKILLSKNFRSRKNILDGANFLFYQLMGASFGDVEYDTDAALYAGADFLDGDVLCGGANEVLLIETQSQEEMAEVLEEMSRRELEAVAIAKRIRQLIADGFCVLEKETGTYRPVQFRDIAVLMRSVKSWGPVLEDVFAKEGIPYYAEVAEGYFDVPEVETVLNILRLIDNPRQDIALIAILYSPIYRLSADDLMQIRLKGGGGQYFDCVKAYSMEGENSCIQDRLNDFLNDLARWRSVMRDLSLYELLCCVYDESGYYDYVGMTAGGSLRQANLRLLLEKAEAFESGRQKDVFFFVRYVEELKTAEAESSSAKLQSEADNLVRVMTIHKSKGLEFPVVFVADMAKQFNEMDMREAVITHAVWGYGMDYKDLERRAVYRTLSKTALAEAIRMENLAEELRVLYVAVTRAKEKLILTGGVKDFVKSFDKWSIRAKADGWRLPTFRLRKARNYLDWVMPALLRHDDAQGILDEFGLEALDDASRIKADVSRWTFSFVRKQALQEAALSERKSTQSQEAYFRNWNSSVDYSKERETVFQVMEWEYKHEKATRLPVKVSISEIKRKHMEQGGEVYPYPAIKVEMPKEKNAALSMAEIGTAMHMVMEAADFGRKYECAEDVSRVIASLLADGRLSEEEGKALRFGELESFFQSDLARRLHHAVQIEKEQSFAMLVDAKAVFSDSVFSDVDEKVLINGIIDCYFVESDGNVVLLDYKSDRVFDETVLKARYEIQMGLYKKALERALSKRVSEVYIYSFAMKDAIRLDL